MKIVKLGIMFLGLALAAVTPAQAFDNVTKRIGQTYRGETVLPVRQLLDLGPAYAGVEVDYVVLTASTAAGRGQAALKVNDFTEGAVQTVGRFSADYFFELRPGQKLGVDIRTLQLHLSGNFTVDAISVYFKSNLIEKRIGQSLRGANTLKLRQILGLDQSYRGKRIKSVVLTASTAAGRGQAQLVVNDRVVSAPQVVGTRTRDYYFDLGRANVIGEDIISLQLDLQGNFFVEAVAVELESDRRGRH